MGVCSFGVVVGVVQVKLWWAAGELCVRKKAVGPKASFGWRRDQGGEFLPGLFRGPVHTPSGRRRGDFAFGRRQRTAALPHFV